MKIIDGKLDGKLVAKDLREKIKLGSANFFETYGRKPGLGVILAGEDSASHVYVKNKELASEAVGFFSKKVSLSAQVTEEQLLSEVDALNRDPQIDAFLVQMPLPSHLKTEVILDRIDPLKDADGLHPVNLGYLWAGRPRVIPCTPWGVMKILEYYDIDPSGKSCAVVGRSQIVGRPMAHLMTQANSTVTVCHSHTSNLREITRASDIVIVAAGKRHFLGKDDFKQGAVVIDVGIHGSGQGGGVTGDVRYSELADWVLAATPVPGGVGPMTIACLLENTLKLANLHLRAKN